MASQCSHKSAVHGIIVGSLSGLVGTILMTQFQILWKKASKEIQPPNQKAQAKHSDKEKKDSTVKTAEEISKAVGLEFTHAEKKKAGNLVHYVFGTSMGAMYGLLRETAPNTVQHMNSTVSGAGYGTLVFLGAHHIVVPALKLGSNPLSEPVPDQISEYLAHLVYGVGTSLTYTTIRRLD
jgi:uncharacterized membrane protein YagU involved in acid resistance